MLNFLNELYQFDISFSYNEDWYKKQRQHYNTLCKWTHGLGQRWHQYMTDHSSISQVHPAPLVTLHSCSPSLSSTSHFSLSAQLSLFFLYSSHQTGPASEAFLSWFMGGENRLNKKDKRIVLWLICRRVSLVICHVFSFCFLERGGGS